jgi:hypothetical protein
MIDSIYKTLLTILNKEGKGIVTPSEYNLLANNVQEEIFREYFTDINRNNSKKNRNMVGSGYSNLVLNDSQKISNFAASDSLTLTTGVGTLPDDLYLMEQDGITVSSTGRVVDQTSRHKMGYRLNSSNAPTEVFPIYERLDTSINVHPITIATVEINYLRKPLVPQWTYLVLESGLEVFDPSSSSYQDFELHSSEYSNILVRLLSLFGVVLREADVVQIAESMKNTNEIKDNQ